MQNLKIKFRIKKKLNKNIIRLYYFLNKKYELGI